MVEVIISTIEGASRTLGSGVEIRWRSLARRGMLFCECEAFDHVRLAPGTELALRGRGREGTEEAWFAVSGSGALLDPGAAGAAGAGHAIRAGDLVLLPAGEVGRLVGGDGGLELLWLAVMPREVTRSLPPRRPVA